MKHNIDHRKLNRTSSHRKSLLMNLSNALIKHEQITTTLTKAKELRPFVEKIVTLGKRGDLESRRKAIAILQDKKMTTKIIIIYNFNIPNLIFHLIKSTILIHLLLKFLFQVFLLEKKPWQG